MPGNYLDLARNATLNGIPPQDPDALSRGLPDPEFNFLSALSKAIEPVHTPLSKLAWAMDYPVRVGQDLLQSAGVLSPGLPKYQRDFAMLVEGNNLLKMMQQEFPRQDQTYTPGSRESTNVIDRRPASIWSYR